ncbi:MAG: dihydrofolate reductase [Propionibacteriales bacterium]|nr:dihydrofolate reductase [Propionibacteriales bacterium]
MTVTLVAAVARNGVIGRDGGLPWHLPGEQQRFKATTMGHVLVMGRRTYESIGRPLPGRTTVVVTRNADWAPPGGRPDDVLVAPNVADALRQAVRIDEQVYVVGGAQVYAESLPHADELLVTHVEAEPEGDTFFPPLEWADWDTVSCEQFDGWSVARYARARASEGYKGRHDNDA